MSRAWDQVVDQIHQALQKHAVAPQRCVVLLPFAQLMGEARQAWARRQATGFAPRFETTRNWAASLAPWQAGPNDLSGDAARDSLIASALLDRVLRVRIDHSLRRELVSRVRDAARQLAPLAASMAPTQRADWAQRTAAALPAAPTPLNWESLVSQLALTWASTSAYATDVLWEATAAPGASADLLLALPGHQTDPLLQALMAHWGDRAETLAWPIGPAQTPRVLACADAEDEAQWAASCVIEHLNAGRQPVALVALDRLSTRRVSALLQEAGASVRDETGWKLSTTQAAASLMSALRAADPQADTDAVLDWLKHAPTCSAETLAPLEQRLRRERIARWRTAVAHPAIAALLPTEPLAALTGLQAPRPLLAWLKDLQRVLETSGQWPVLQADAAGQQLLAALRLGDAAHELAALGQWHAQDAPPPRPWRLATFTAWVRDVLEGASFMPPSPADPQVLVVPMAQLLGRSVAAVVVPGCDDQHWPASVEPPGAWTAAQREALGLPGRQALTEAALAARAVLRSLPWQDLLWRRQDRGETLAPSPHVPALASAPVARPERELPSEPTQRPAPTAAEVLPTQLSASAYEDLRTCPYRFFAQRQLQLVDQPELQAEPDQRDWGNWLHEVLRRFHEARGTPPPDASTDRAALDACAREVAAQMGFASEAGAASFLPFQAQWPALRDGYLAWLATHEASGPRFGMAEEARRAQAGAWPLVGQLDRIDLQASPEGDLPFVIDYKTESRSRTRERLKNPSEDTQLAFYAALMPNETLRAAYLSITDARDGKEAATELFEHTDVIAARDRLLAGLVHDLDRIAAGAPLPALGEGKACEVCAVRGLCRRDFWS